MNSLILFAVILANTQPLSSAKAKDKSAPESESIPALTLDDCLKIALKGNPDIAVAEAKVHDFQARLQEVKSLSYPKLMATAFVAPMFSSDFGDIGSMSSSSSWSKISDWGPYTNLEALAVQPLYSFGRIGHAKDAARHRMLVEKATVREARNLVALETRKYYHLHLYALSLKPTLKMARRVFVDAIEKAEESFDEGDGTVTLIDVSKLKYGLTEIEKYIIRADAGASLAKVALKHMMGWPADRPLQLQEKRLSKKVAGELPQLPQLIVDSAEHRPEWSMLDHGDKAALALQHAEALANMPIIALAGQFRASWTPSRDNTHNPYHYDPYNDVFGGLALAIQFDLDPAKTAAREEMALAKREELVALRRFASTGIPLQVRQAYSGLAEAQAMSAYSAAGTKEAKRWLTSAATGFMAGTGEAKDLLEGLIAYLTAKKGHYDSLLAFYTAQSQLHFAVGTALASE